MTRHEVLDAVAAGRVAQSREHTEDQARFYRHHWLLDGLPANKADAKAFENAAQDGDIGVGWAGIIGTGVQTARLT
jgi:hypothetical protein